MSDELRSPLQPVAVVLGGLLARPSQLTVYPVTGSLHPIGGRPIDTRDAD